MGKRNKCKRLLDQDGWSKRSLIQESEIVIAHCLGMPDISLVSFDYDIMMIHINVCWLWLNCNEYIDAKFVYQYSIIVDVLCKQKESWNIIFRCSKNSNCTREYDNLIGAILK